MKKALLIGGTGTISSAITRQLAADNAWDVWLLNRGNRPERVPTGVHTLVADVNDEETTRKVLMDYSFDCVCDFICFLPEQAERDIRLFKGKTKQFILVSSASAYQKPAASPFITEGTPLVNPYWQYSRNKIACEELLMKACREDDFPVTIVRPSHTYDERRIPVGVHGRIGSWQVARRLLEGKPVIIHGDGTSLWTMTHNSDFARAFIGLMGNVHALGNAFQITSDEVLSWNQIYASLAQALNVELKAVHVSSDFLASVSDYDLEGNLMGDKAVSVVFDNAKLHRVVPGWHAEVRFDEGIRRTVDYILAHPELQLEDPEFDAWCDRVIEVREKAIAMMK